MDSKQWNYVSLAAVAVMLVAAVWLFWPPNTTIKQGLDIQGGLSVILTAERRPTRRRPTWIGRCSSCRTA
jgi:preprotein translocase subunit SecD